jgi:hypothetical protein
MAGDWIKMRMDLQTHPKVVRMMSALRADKFRVIGGLHAVWSVFDAHSEDGVLDGYTCDAMDAVIGWPGFTQAMLSIGWISSGGDETLVMPRFDDHNGKSSKRRAQETVRKRESRRSDDEQSNVVEMSASSADEKRTREEKRREDKPNTSPNGDVVIGDADSELPNGLPNCPHQRLIALYAQHLPTLPFPRTWDGERAKSMRTRWKWVLTAKKRDGSRYATDEASAIDFFERFFRYASESDFLTGRNGKWTSCDLGWLMKSENFGKVLQGNYENKEAAA